MPPVLSALRFIHSRLLDGLFAFRFWQLQAHTTNRIEKQTALDELMQSSTDIQSIQRSESIAYLRNILKNAPYWARGHLNLGEISFVQNDMQLSYSSALAVQKLSSSGPLHDRALHLQSKVMLRAGDFANAIRILEMLTSRPQIHPDILNEDLGAAYLAAGDESSAKASILKIPESKRSMSCVSALEYLNRVKE